MSSNTHQPEIINPDGQRDMQIPYDTIKKNNHYHMKAFFIISALITGIINASGQNDIEKILESIEQNNTFLHAIRAEIEAEKIGNKTGLTPSNPEIEFNYLWGNPSSIGNRNDFAVVQSFDFPTAYAYRSQIATIQNEQAELEYMKQRNELFHSARLLFAELIWMNSLVSEYSLRVEHAERVTGSYQRMFDVGETNIIEVNKAGVNLLNISQKLERLRIERRQLLSELEKINGGKPVEFSDSKFPVLPMGNDFQQWYALAEQKNPVLKGLNQQITLSQKQVQLNKALRLPKFQAGYMSEKVVGEQFQGITAGVSIPLWENKNRVDYARQKADAAALQEADFRFRYYSEMETLFNKAIALQVSAAAYQERLQELDNRPLLEKALEAGQISLSDYLLGLSVYYDAVDNLLEMKLNALTAYYSLYRFY